MNLTIYVPDALGERVRASDINVSATCQAALERELAMISAIEDVEQIRYTDADGVQHFFYGRHVAHDDERGREWDVYLTKHGRLATIKPDSGYDVRLDVRDSFEEFEVAFAARPQLVAQVADALAVKDWGHFLDI